MEKVLKPERFDINSTAPNATKLWRHWLATFGNLLVAIESENLNKLTVLTNYVSADVYELFGEVANYDAALEILKAAYARTPNEIFARHASSTRKQQPDESVDEYLQILKSLSKECNYRQVTAVQYREEVIQDTFKRELQNANIGQRLLENERLDLQAAVTQARALDIAQKNADLYKTHVTAVADLTPPPSVPPLESDHSRGDSASCAALKRPNCYFCGFTSHSRSKCPAREAVSRKHKKKGYYQRVCQSKGVPANELTAAAMYSPLLAMASLRGVPVGLRKSSVFLSINKKKEIALVDSESTDSFIHPRLVDASCLKIQPIKEKNIDGNQHFNRANSGILYSKH